MDPSSIPGPLWWDRDTDDKSTPLRADVRQAAREFWPDACLRTRNTLGDDSQSAELLESSAAHLSKELNARQATPLYADVSSQLSLYFSYELARRAGRLGIGEQKRRRDGFGPQGPGPHLAGAQNVLPWPASSANLGQSLLERNGCWLDRGAIDGIPLRDDVRCAAELGFSLACKETRKAMGDAEEAAALMEKAVAEACQYLDQKRQQPSVPKARALLMKIFRRRLMRRAMRLKREKPESETLEFRAVIVNWEDPMIASFTLEKIEGCISREAFNIWVLMKAEYDWDEIARMFGTTATAIKKRFWREIEHAKIKLGIKAKKDEGSGERRRRRRG